MVKSHSNAAALRDSIRVFQLFGHPARLVMFQRLARQAMTAGELAKGLSITRPAVVQQLKILEAAHLVTAAADKKRRLYRADPRGLVSLQIWLARYLK